MEEAPPCSRTATSTRPTYSRLAASMRASSTSARSAALPLYDVAHWALHAPPDHLLAGYAQVAPLPGDHERIVARLSIEIGNDILGRIAGRGNKSYESVLRVGIARAEAALR